MERIIIQEVDNTSNVEALSSFDVAYVPGFATVDDGAVSALYRVPTFVRDKYEFVKYFGTSAPVFKTNQTYPNQFAEAAIKFNDQYSSYDEVETNGFGSVEETINSGLYKQVESDNATPVNGFSYYQGEADETTGIISLSTISSATYKKITDIIGKAYCTISTPSATTEFVEGKTYLQSSSDPITYELLGEDPGTYTDTYVIDTVTRIAYEAFDADTAYEITATGPAVLVKSADSTAVQGVPGGMVFSSDENPKNNNWYEEELEGYVITSDTSIDPTAHYFVYESSTPYMFDEGDSDPGWRYAYGLLSMGMPVYFEQMNSSTDDITVKNMYKGLTSRFINDPNSPDDSFDSIGDYSIKFITSGGYPTFEYDDNGLAEAMIRMAGKRADSIALIDHTDNPVRPLTTYDEDSVISAIREWDSIGDEIEGTYGAMFTPWFECSNPAVITNPSTGDSVINKTMPGSYAYLSSLCQQLLNYNPWLAVSGVSRGKVPYFVKNHTDKPLTNNIADSYQALPNETGGSVNISINPITYIRNYGYCIWGNRTLRNNATGTKASSFLNIRSAVSDIKKRLYEASQSLLFEQNTDVLWVNFKSLVSPLLETMKADYILDDYAITRLYVDPKTGAAVPAYEVMAVIRIQPINSVEIFDLTVYMENSEEFNITTVETI